MEDIRMREQGRPDGHDVPIGAVKTISFVRPLAEGERASSKMKPVEEECFLRRFGTPAGMLRSSARLHPRPAM